MNIAEDFYLVRTPILPVEFPEQLNNTSFNELPDAIKNIFQDDLLQEAIYIASPELYQEFRKWQEGRLTGEKDVQKLTSALFRYLLRMSSRCTPYGLFAGCATGHPGDVTSITLHDKTQHKKHSRLDMNYVAELASMITSIPEIQEQLRYYPNNSLYRTGSTYRYAAFTIKNKFRNYYLTSVNASEYLEKIFQVAENGATLTDIRSAVISEDVTGEEAEEFISELISSQLLVSGLEPTVTGDEFFQLLIRKLEMLQHTNEYTNVLQRINGLLKEQQTGTSKYVGIHSLVKSLLTDTTNKDLIQTDLFLSTTSNTLGSKVISDITRQVNQLWKLARANNNGDLRQFCNSFRQRYEEQEIPLTLALDTESGIGYAGHSGSHTDHTPLVDDLVTPPSDRNETMNRSKMLEFQLQQLHACLRENKQEIVLTDEHLGQLKETDTPRLPYSMYLMGSILAGSAAAIDAGEYLFEMNGCSGPSAANLLGRFCHGDEQLTAHVNACLRAEEQHDPECIYAEIIHLPESRTGNILMRPRLRSYEIVYLANSDAPAEYQIPVSDLMVSVQRDKVVLRSRRLNKRVIPRLSTAHNFRHGLPLYKFLCDLQTQDLHAGLAWGWQIPGNERFLPRVRYGNIILSKAQWILNKKDYPGLKKDNTTAYAETCREMRKQLQLPRHIVIAEGDNELLIDFENESSLHLLATTLIKKEQLVLQEFLGTPDNCWIESAGGKHTNEFIIPLRNADKANEAAF
ncbi:MAG TPA: lantibiotic dehydratase family protein, partial [Chitinophaga sp.]|uniref:lantibiotic dehydratase family protein n=1 Tax=Chitinophaga sp. TaxID=1869181 RepID=UPI002CF7BA00